MFFLCVRDKLKDVLIEDQQTFFKGIRRRIFACVLEVIMPVVIISGKQQALYSQDFLCPGISIPGNNHFPHA